MVSNVDAVTSSAIRAAEGLLALTHAKQFPVDVHALGEAQGIKRITTMSLDPGELARLVGLRTFRIYVSNKDFNPGRIRFSICHEIAHTFFVDRELHESAGLTARVDLPSRLNYEAEEIICDEAAACLLMPRDPFIEVVTAAPPSLVNLERIASMFQASSTAVLRRIQSLKLAWNCVLVRWSPVDEAGLTTGFRLLRNWSIDGKTRPPFAVDSVLPLDGLFRTLKTLRKERMGLIAVDTCAGFRLESRAYRRGNSVEILSLATQLERKPS